MDVTAAAIMPSLHLIFPDATAVLGELNSYTLQPLA